MKKKLTTILTRLFGNELGRKTDEMKPGLQGVEVIMQPVEPKRTRYDDPDLNILAERYGELKLGKVITIELNEAARLLGRKRIRLDAFSGLIKKLHNDYGVELKIYSRRTKLNERKD
jgi:exosome complex RNA-binding protein Rrp4